nr:fatty acyl-AMP ligase [Kibdelosporangium sp. MJ126-NF4]CEL16416.1 Non-ribosomal peptide synthase [Kibdelosporangium sp. MJ126-NF4]CTQ90368.1 Non-ribosomal peptide synthase [Kibdelosporangium sp. MJ126-NF4]
MANLPGQNRTVAEAVRAHAARDPLARAFGFVDYDTGSDTEWFTYGDLDTRARAVAARLAEDLSPGDRALILLPSGLDYVVAFLGCRYAGVVAVPAFPPEAHRRHDRLDGMAADASAAAVLTSTARLSAVRAWADMYPEPLPPLVSTVDNVPLDLARDWREPPVDDGPAYLQYTSGSTGTPRGVRVSDANLLVQSAQLAEAYQLDSDDVVVSWLPLFHDFGLIAMTVVPLVLGAATVHMSPMSFLADPARWLRLATEHRATLMGAPNFGYELCVERAADTQGLDLSGIRVLMNGAEPVRGATVTAFDEAFARHGLRPGTTRPAYGLAEATLVISTKDTIAPVPALTVDREALGAGKVLVVDPGSPGAADVVCCGTPVTDMDIRIVDPATATESAEDEVGEVWVRGPIIADGYHGHRSATAETFGAVIVKPGLADTGEGPFLRTGDLGFLNGGAVYVAGRLKDLVIVDGRNHHPQDVESTVERAFGDRGVETAIAFGVDVDDREHLVVVVELDHTTRRGTLDELTAGVRAEISAEHGVGVHEVVFVRRRTAPRTTSGKIQRRDCRARYLAGELRVVTA